MATQEHNPNMPIGYFSPMSAIEGASQHFGCCATCSITLAVDRLQAMIRKWIWQNKHVLFGGPS